MVNLIRWCQLTDRPLLREEGKKERKADLKYD